MAQIVRLREIGQACLPLGHGSVRWETLPETIRERVLALWLELMAQHLGHPAEVTPAVALPAGDALTPSAEAES